MLLLGLVACHRGGLPLGPCQSLDENSCRSRADCRAGSCADCEGRRAFTGCYDPRTAPGTACPSLCPPPCAALDENACAARSDCVVLTCEGCEQSVFRECALPGAAPTQACPLGDCFPCAQITDLASCAANGGCHPVFIDSDCACASPGCCAKFDRCANGAKADCTGASLTCFLVEPTCNPPFVVAYENLCYEGCVRQTDCAP